MTMSKNAIGNLINRYKAVLSKCRLLNTLGSLAVAGALVLGAGGAVMAADSGGTNVPGTGYVGSFSLAGDATGGNVHIDTGKSGMDIFGGDSYNGNATNNSITMTGGEAARITGGYAAGQSSHRGDAINNTVTISGGSIDGNVDGGRAEYGNANNNTVTISGGSIKSSVASGSAGNGGNAIGNTVTISGGATISQSVYGGYASSGNVIGNTVTISGGNFGSAATDGVYGGRTFDYGNAIGNTVTISGGAFNGGTVAGGHADYGNAIGNTVTISGGTISGVVYGGASSNGDAIGNTITISGGTVFRVQGGWARGIVENNTVIYSGGMIREHLHGGYAATASVDSRNNTLVTIGKREVGGDVQWFQNYHFVLDANQNTGLTAGGAFIMDRYTNNILGVDALGGGTLPKEGDTLTLVQANNIIDRNGGSGVTAGSTGIGKKGATMLFDYQVINPNHGDKIMTAKVSNVRVNPQAKALSEGVAANAALVNMGADAVAGAGMASALAASANNAPAGTTTIAPFGTMQAGSSRIETGSHVNVSSLNFIAGIALGQQTEFGKLLVGPFFEAGFGSYNTYNSFDNAASVNGNGRTNFLGAGILARFDFADMALGHPWLEGSFRIGHAFNSYNNDDLKDGADNTADYDTDAPYQSFHVGLGYMFNLTEADHLDVYGKYFWSHLGGSDVKVLGDPVNFDDVFSSRLRFGGRYSHDFGTDKNYSISPYIGAAWEHEFDGKARATTYGRDIKAPTLKGDTGIGELGVTFKHQNGLSLDLGLNGYVGKRQGVMGNLMLKYEF